MEEKNPKSPRDIKIITLEPRYWIGYQQVNESKFRFALFFTNKYLKWLFPIVLSETKILEQDRFDNPVQKEWTEMMWEDDSHTDSIISRAFLKPDESN